jgi:MauM/NapG family ferredoxin protein
MENPDQATRRRGFLRTAGRWFVLITAGLLAWPGRTDSSLAVILPALSPFTGLCSAGAVRGVGLLTVCALPVLLLVVMYPRWFCRHACPTGFLQELLQRLRPGATGRWPGCPPLGPWVALLTLGGAVFGLPLFLWLDPLAIFNGFLNAWRAPLAIASLASGLALPALLVLDLVFPRLWCQRLCPLGATQDLLMRSRHWLGQIGRVRSAPADQSVRPARRWFLSACLGAAGAGAWRAAGSPPSPLLRPPGALDEARFKAVCVRCGNCAQTCPSKIIQPDFGAGGVAGFLAPRLQFDADFCRKDCRRCHQVCPSGAITRLSLAQKQRQVIGPAKVDLDTCLLANGRECVACIRQCPYEAIAMKSTDGGFSNQPVVDLARCTGCGACEAVCPVRPKRAILVTAKPGVLPT